MEEEELVEVDEDDEYDDVDEEWERQGEEEVENVGEDMVDADMVDE